MKGKYCKIIAAVLCGIPILVYFLAGVPVLTKLFVDYLAQKTPFLLVDGDAVQCIPIRNLVRKLPVAPTPTWRMAPSTQPHDTTVPDLSPFQSIKQATQLIAAEKQTCPMGTVPIRSRPGYVFFNRMSGRKAYHDANSTVPKLDVASSHNRHLFGESSASALWPDDHDSHKYALINVNGPYRGTQGRLNIWHPHVQRKEFSLAQVWISSVDANGNLHTLESGWQIYEEFYRDSKPRLFVYWTTDNYSTSGCYNLQCPGFIQVSSKWLLGGSFAEVSTLKSDFQYEIKIRIFKDSGTGDWWLQLNDENVGYWPKSLFGPGAFNEIDTRIDWGGEIWHQPGHYTNTQMGSGEHPASSGHRKVAYVRNLLVVDRRDNLSDPPAPTAPSTYQGCCNLMLHERSPRWGTYAYFGGPGFNAECVQNN